MLISVQTPAAGGTAYAQFAAQWCQNGNGYLLNDTGTSLDVKIGAAASPITVANGKGIPFKLVFNCDELFVRRTDQATAQVTVEAQVGIEEVPSDGGGTSGPVAAADITDAGTAGITVLQAETQAQVRAAAGFGGTVTVAQLNAAGDDAKSAMWYCSDCLTTNGPGSIVAWCSRTSTWRTLDDCLLATASFAELVNDFVQNSSAPEIRGTKGYLFCTIGGLNNIAAVFVNSGSVNYTAGTVENRLHLQMSTGTANVNGYTRATTSAAIGCYTTAAKPMVFAAIKNLKLSSVGSGFTVRIGITNASNTANTLRPTEYSACWDAGNKLGGLNAGLASEWLACYRSSSVNLAGSGPTGVGETVNSSANLCVIRSGDSVVIERNGVVISTGAATESDMLTMHPFAVIANDGIEQNNVDLRTVGFCGGVIFP